MCKIHQQDGASPAVTEQQKFKMGLQRFGWRELPHVERLRLR